MKRFKKTTKWALLLTVIATLLHVSFLPSLQAQASQRNIEIENSSIESNAYTLTNSAFVQAFDLYYKVSKKADDTITIPSLYLKDGNNLSESEKGKFTASILDNIAQNNIGFEYYVYDKTKENVVSNTENKALTAKELDKRDLNLFYDWYLVVTFDENGVPFIDQNASSHRNLASTQDYYSAFNTIFQGEFATINTNDSTTFIFNNDESKPYEYQPIKNVTFRFAVEYGYFTNNSVNYYYYSPNGPMFQYFMIISILLISAMGLFMFSHKKDEQHEQEDHDDTYTPEVIIVTKKGTKRHKWSIDSIPIECMLFFDAIAFGISTAIGDLCYNTFPALIVLFFLYLFVANNVIYFFHMFQNKSIKQHSICVWAWKYLHEPMKKLYDYALHLDMGKQDTKRIFIIIFINFLMLLFIQIFYEFSSRFFFLILYSVGLFFLLRKYLGSINKDYHRLLEVIRNIAVGKTNDHIEENLGIFNPFKPELKDIQTNFETAIAEEVHSQQMKTELITNVSHDLKTPLTSLISYIDLLNKENITDAERKKYLTILVKSSDRLKHLVEDLFEVSKANSGNVSLDFMKVDIVSLMKQVLVECNDALKKQKLTIRSTFSDDKIILLLDSQKTYRIFENLISNISKYSLKGTRVYIDIKDYDTFVEISMKNISAQELNFDVEDITERFMRGDKARNTEGSGLGLAIVKSFTELQNGTLKIQTEGDLFKVLIRLPKEEDDTKEAEA